MCRDLYTVILHGINMNVITIHHKMLWSTYKDIVFMSVTFPLETHPS